MTEEKKSSSWKTTLLGVLGLVSAACLAVVAGLDGDEATKVNYEAVLAAIAIVFPSVGALFSKDADK